MRKRILIAVGGTGGHVFPALTLAKQLTNENPQLDILFVGGGLSKNRYFEQSTFAYKEIDCGTLTPRKPLKSLKNIWKITRGITQSYSIINKFKPDLIVGFGSFHTLPTLLATNLLRIPYVLHEANRIPGKVNRLLSKYSTLTGVQFPDTSLRMKGNIQTISLPLREGFHFGSSSQIDARSYYNLNPNLPVVLIFGGSQGAQAINKMAAEALVNVAKTENLQILHFTGNSEMTQQLLNKYGQHNVLARVKDFETRMDLAWQSADLVISRSGAGTLTEAMEFEVPGIYIPYPQATDNHQESNADFMADVVKCGIRWREKDLTVEILENEIKALFSQNRHRIKVMQQAMRNHKRINPQATLCSAVMKLIKG
jgi:UDP-N-acetylglucosamine--N-acetylmuramyl-(pentapeptide) pyrophosphoryl-undecaprenol N-acetylglucosamine transferase